MTLLNAQSAPGLWPMLRCDPSLRGHQQRAGNIVDPAVAWRQYLGGPLFDGRLVAAASGADLLLPFGGCVHRFDVGGDLIWKSRALGIEALIAVDDVDADGRVEIVASNGKSIIILDAASGEILWQEYLGPPFAGGFMHTAARVHRFIDGEPMQLAVGLLSSNEVVVYDFAAGARRPARRHILWMDDFFHPSVIAADLNGDGQDELVVTKLSSVYAFDPVTGRRTAECRWSSGGTPKRNYGLLEAVDVDGSGALDLVVLSDRVSRHIALVGNDGGGELRNRWDRFIEHIYESDETELRFVASSVIDIDRDGKHEIVVSIFNAHGDNRWHLEIIDAASGQTRTSIPDAFLRGIDVDSAAPRVLVSMEAARVPGARAALVSLEWRDGMLREAWSLDNAAFVGRYAADVPTRALFRTDLPPMDDVRAVRIDGRPRTCVIEDAGVGFVDGNGEMTFVPDTFDAVSIVAVGDLDGDGNDEIVVSNMRGAVNILRPDGTSSGSIACGMRLRPGTGAYYMAKPMATPVVHADADMRYLAVPDGGDHVHVMSWNAATMRPDLTARIAMRGRTGPEEAYSSVTWCTLDGAPAIIGSAIGGDRAALIAVDPRGEELMRWSIPDLPASPAVPTARTGIHEYIAVDVADGQLIVVSGFRSPSMNSETTVAVDASDGRERWRLDGIRVPGHVLGPAPWSAASLSFAGAERHLHFLAKDSLVHIDAASGSHVDKPLQLRPYNAVDMAARGLTMDDFSAYGSVVPLEIDGRMVRLLVANYGGHGLIDDDGSAIWWRSAPLSMLTGSFGGIADVDGDGRLELGVSDATGDFVCLDVATGAEKWRLHPGVVATGVATCDIDACGRSEFVVSTREGLLLAIGVASNGSGLIKWQLDLGYTLGPPIIADLDGDGRSEILVVSGDGALYAVS